MNRDPLTAPIDPARLAAESTPIFRESMRALAGIPEQRTKPRRKRRTKKDRDRTTRLAILNESPVLYAVTGGI